MADAMQNQDLNAQNDNFGYTHFTGEIDSQRGRAAYSSAEKAYEQFNVATSQRIQVDAALAEERLRNMQFTEDERQFRLRAAEEEHAQRLRHQETEHQLMMQAWTNNIFNTNVLNALMLRIVSGGITNEQMAAREVLDQLSSLMAKTTDLTPPANIGTPSTK